MDKLRHDGPPGLNADSSPISVQVSSPHLSSSFSVAHKTASCGFHNIKCYTGKGYWLFAQPPTWRTRCCSSSDLSPGTFPARMNLPGTAVPAEIASRVTKAPKPPHHRRCSTKGGVLKNTTCLNSSTPQPVGQAYIYTVTSLFTDVIFK